MMMMMMIIIIIVIIIIIIIIIGCHFIGGLGGVSEQVDPWYQAIVAIIVEERLDFMIKVAAFFPSPCNELQEVTRAKNSKIKGRHLCALVSGKPRQVDNEITALT